MDLQASRESGNDIYVVVRFSVAAGGRATVNINEGRLLLPGQDEAGRGDEHEDRGNPAERLHAYSIDSLSHDFRITRYQHDEYEQRRSKKSVQHRAPEQGADRI